MIERLRLALDANHLPLMKQDDEGSYVKYEDVKAALCGIIAIPGYSSAFTEVRSLLGDEVVDEWIGVQNIKAYKDYSAGSKTQ